MLTVYEWHVFFSYFLWWPLSCNSLHHNAWDLPSYIPCGISTHYISRTGAWESFSQSTLALKSLGQHTDTLDSALVNSHWARHVWTPGIIFTSLLIYLHLSFSSKIRNCFTCMMQTKGPDVHASVNQHGFAPLNRDVTITGLTINHDKIPHG